MKTFKEFGLKQTTEQFIQMNGFYSPTPIQEKVIPYALKGKDIIGLSETGTGKTHAYLIPLMEKVDTSLNQVQAVITAPTRELAVQIYEKARKMQEVEKDLRISLFVGGRDRQKDIRKLEENQPHIAIGTPGRIRDLFLDAGALRLDKAEILIVDEADMTLEFGFLNEIDAFAGRMKEPLHMMAFSATMPDQLKPFIRKYMHHPITLKIDREESFNPKIHHVLVPCRNHPFEEAVLSILPGFMPYVCLIFANTRDEAGKIAGVMKKNHYSVTELHGDLSARQRKQAMKEIENSTHTYVVATDLAARGIDLSTVTHVISCGFPEDLEYYIHRAGRTARAGKDGVCYALYHDSDDASIRSLMRQGIHFDQMRYANGEWKKLRPYGQKRMKPDDEMEKKISMMMTKKNTKVRPGYKKKRAAAIEKLHREKKRDYIRGKIREEKKAIFKQKQIEKNRENGK